MANGAKLTADEAAEKAYAEAAAATSGAEAKPAKQASAAPKQAKSKKVAGKKSATQASAVEAKAPVKAEKSAAANSNTTDNSKTDTISGVDLFKDMIMAKKNDNQDITATVQEAAGQAQEQFKAAYDKSSEVTAEMVELSKGNMEAVVEAGKIFAAGVQDMGQTLVSESQEAMETATAEAKKLAGVKSPTEFFQIQNEIAKRSFDMFMANSSKNTEAFVKLTNETMAPLSTRASVAVEKISKVAA